MKWLKSRTNQILLMVMVMMAILGLRLFDLTVVEGSVWDERASSISVKTISTSAPREKFWIVMAGCLQAIFRLYCTL
jgi:cell division protein FtsI/penicillin-binding protein 2